MGLKINRKHATGAVVIVVALLAVVVIGRAMAHREAGAHQTKAVYYCPMHPSYTSDRPGDCPICNMKLVKREGSVPAVPAQAVQSAAQKKQDVCYMHSCPMMKPGQRCPMLVVAKRGESVTCPICGAHVAGTPNKMTRKILYWTDPMIPGYRATEPGKSPMGMDLVPVYEEETAGESAATQVPGGYAPVLLTPQKQQLIGVKTAVAEKRAITKTIRTVGTVAHDPELYQAEAEFIEASVASQRASGSEVPEMAVRAQALVESSRLRLRHMGLSEEMIEELGRRSEPDHRLLLGGAGQYWVYASIYEYELPLVRTGEAASVEVTALPGLSFSGTVKAIDPMVDPTSRTTRVRIVVEDTQGVLKPDMYVNVAIAVDLGTVLAVPEEAVFHTGTKDLVFVEKGEGLFEPREVTLGPKADSLYQVAAGISVGERVVTSGNFLIDSESRLKAAAHGP